MSDIQSTPSRNASAQRQVLGPSRIQAEPTPEPDAGSGSLLAHLIIGALAEGSDEALRRLRQWHEEAQHHARTDTTLTDDHPLRWMLLGLLFETQAGMRNQLAELRQRGTRVLYHPNVTLHSLEDSMRQWLPSGFTRRIDMWRARGQRGRARWIREGYLAEQEGRQLARYATEAAIEELLAYMARNPRVRALIEQQAVGVADEAVGEMRARAASADTRLEQITHALLRRAPSTHPPAFAGQAPDTTQAAPHASFNSGHAEKAK